MGRKYKKNYELRLLDHIKFRTNARVKSMLTKNFINKYSSFETLLHHAALHDNDEIARYLIQLGSDVDGLGQEGLTPLMVAVNAGSHATIRVLLDANANIDILNADNKSALQLLFDQKYGFDDILLLFLNKIRANGASCEELAVKLIRSGCNLHHVFFLNDIDMIESMLNNGVDVDATKRFGETALHLAIEENNLRLAKGLIEAGANVNALNEHGQSPLLFAVHWENRDLIQLLLENGADPNIESAYCKETPLFILIVCVSDSPKRTECIELLLQHGAIPRNSRYSITIFDLVMESENSDTAKMLIAQLALLEKMGKPIDKSVMQCEYPENQSKLQKLADYYKLSEQALATIMFRKLSLFHLLASSDFKMRTYVRNENFIPKIEEICSELQLGESYPYYYNTLMKCITKAVEVVKLENNAIPILCRFFSGNENECYIAARIVVGYLNKRDLEQLCRV